MKRAKAFLIHKIFAITTFLNGTRPMQKVLPSTEHCLQLYKLCLLLAKRTFPLRDSCIEIKSCALTNPLIPVHAEEPGVMSLLHYYEGDAWLIIFLQLDAGLTNSQQFML